MKRNRRLWIAIGLLSAPGCGGGGDKDNEVVPIDKVPPALLKAAKDKLSDVQFDSAYRGQYQGQEIYEIRGKTKAGKIRECEVNLKGDVLNVE